MDFQKFDSIPEHTTGIPSERILSLAFGAETRLPVKELTVMSGDAP